MAVPLPAAADELASSEPETTVSSLPQMIISEVQTGNLARLDEFIELHNTTDQPIDLTSWQLRYITASETSVKNVEQPSATISLSPAVVEGVTALVAPHGYYLLYSGVVV